MRSKRTLSLKRQPSATSVDVLASSTAPPLLPLQLAKVTWSSSVSDAGAARKMQPPPSCAPAPSAKPLRSTTLVTLTRRPEAALRGTVMSRLTPAPSSAHAPGSAPASVALSATPAAPTASRCGAKPPKLSHTTARGVGGTSGATSAAA